MRECYHKNCDNSQEKFYDPKFIKKITEAVSWAVSDLAEGECGPYHALGIPEYFNLTFSNTTQDVNNSLTTIFDLLKMISKRYIFFQ